MLIDVTIPGYSNVIKKEVGFFGTGLYRDARSTKHKILCTYQQSN